MGASVLVPRVSFLAASAVSLKGGTDSFLPRPEREPILREPVIWGGGGGGGFRNSGYLIGVCIFIREPYSFGGLFSGPPIFVNHRFGSFEHQRPRESSHPRLKKAPS